MKKRKIAQVYPPFLNLLLIIASILAPLIAAEYLFRSYRLLAGKPPYYTSHPLLGWAPVQNITIKNMPVISSSGRKYSVNYDTDQYGFRYSERDWQRLPDESSPTILVIGDSFTGDAYSSDQDAWFSRLNTELGWRVFAYGIGGAGTSQQILFLDLLPHGLKPDIFLLQACTNDILNNDSHNMFTSNIRNQELRRPYIAEDGTIFYASGLYPSIYRFLFNSSQLFAFLDNQLSKKGFTLALPSQLASLLIDKRWTQTASTEKTRLSRTKSLISQFAKRTKQINPDSRIFSVLCLPDKSGWWQSTFTDAGITYLNDPLEMLTNDEKSGLDIRTEDHTHWNDIANRKFGKYLVDQIKTLY